MKKGERVAQKNGLAPIFVSPEDIGQIISGAESEKIKQAMTVTPGMRIAISMHDNPASDADAIAASFGIKAILVSLGAKIDEIDIFGSISITHLVNRALKGYLRVDDFKDREYYEKRKDQYAKVILVDCAPGNTTLMGVKPDIIFDHHDGKTVSPEGCLLVNKPDQVGSASTLVYLLLRLFHVKMTVELATALAVGVVSDTKHLTKTDECYQADALALRDLLWDGDYQMFARICFLHELNTNYLKMVGQGFSRLMEKEYVSMVCVGCIPPQESENLAAIADMCLRVEQTKLAVAFGFERDNEEIYLVAKMRHVLDAFDFFKYIKEVFDVELGGDETGGKRKGSGGIRVRLRRMEKSRMKEAADKISGSPEKLAFEFNQCLELFWKKTISFLGIG